MPASRGHLVFQAFTTAVKAVNPSKRPRTIHKFAGKQSVQLQGAPLGASVACLDMTELVFDDSEWVFDLALMLDLTCSSCSCKAAIGLSNSRALRLLRFMVVCHFTSLGTSARLSTPW